MAGLREIRGAPIERCSFIRSSSASLSISQTRARILRWLVKPGGDIQTDSMLEFVLAQLTILNPRDVYLGPQTDRSRSVASRANEVCGEEAGFVDVDSGVRAGGVVRGGR